MFEEAPDNALDPDVLREAGHAGPQAAYAAHDEVDFDAGGRCPVERVHDLRIDERVHLAPDLRRAAGFGVGDFLFDEFDEPRRKRQRRHGDLVEPLGFRVAGRVVEQAGCVVAEGPVRREEGQVRIDARIDRVVVAGAVMGVAAQPVLLPAHDQRQLAVRLEVDEPVHHERPGPLQVPGPADVGLLVETRLELDQGGDRLARLRRLDEGGDDGRVLRGPVERLLDRHHVGVARGLAQETHDDIEALIGVVNDDILGADGGEAVAAEIADALRKARLEGLEQQVRPAPVDELVHVAEADRTAEREHIADLGAEPPRQRDREGLRHPRIDGELHDIAAPPPPERRFEQADQILRLLLDLHLAVADHAVGAGPAQFEPGEEVPEEQRDKVLDGQEAAGGAGQGDEAVELAGDRHQRLEFAPVRRAVQVHRQPEAEIGYEREGMSRIDRERRQDREYVAHEVGFEPVPVLLRERAAVHEVDAGPAKLRLQAPPAGLLAAHQAPGAAVDCLQLLRRRQPIGARRADAGGLLALQPGDAHHVELVQVLGGDRQETQTLQKRVGRVRRLFQHALVEGEPGHLAVDEPRRRIQSRPVESASVYRHGGLRLLPAPNGARTSPATRNSGRNYTLTLPRSPLCRRAGWRLWRSCATQAVTLVRNPG